MLCPPAGRAQDGAESAADALAIGGALGADTAIIWHALANPACALRSGSDAAFAASLSSIVPVPRVAAAARMRIGAAGALLAFNGLSVRGFRAAATTIAAAWGPADGLAIGASFDARFAGADGYEGLWTARAGIGIRAVPAAPLVLAGAADLVTTDPVDAPRRTRIGFGVAPTDDVRFDATLVTGEATGPWVGAGIRVRFAGTVDLLAGARSDPPAVSAGARVAFTDLAVAYAVRATADAGFTHAIAIAWRE